MSIVHCYESVMLDIDDNVVALQHSLGAVMILDGTTLLGDRGWAIDPD